MVSQSAKEEGDGDGDGEQEDFDGAGAMLAQQKVNALRREVGLSVEAIADTLEELRYEIADALGNPEEDLIEGLVDVSRVGR